MEVDFQKLKKLIVTYYYAFPICPTVNCSINSPNIINHMRCLNLYRSRFQSIIASVNLWNGKSIWTIWYMERTIFLAFHMLSSEQTLSVTQDHFCLSLGISANNKIIYCCTKLNGILWSLTTCVRKDKVTLHVLAYQIVNNNHFLLLILSSVLWGLFQNSF